MGDLEAQIALAELGVRRFQELMETYEDTVLQATVQLMDYTEAMLRREIEKIPTAIMSPKVFSTMTAATAAWTLPLGDREGARRRRRGRHDGLVGAGADRFNVPFDGSTKVACFFAFRALLRYLYA